MGLNFTSQKCMPDVFLVLFSKEWFSFSSRPQQSSPSSPAPTARCLTPTWSTSPTASTLRSIFLWPKNLRRHLPSSRRTRFTRWPLCPAPSAPRSSTSTTRTRQPRRISKWWSREASRSSRRPRRRPGRSTARLKTVPTSDAFGRVVMSLLISHFDISAAKNT